MIDTTIWDQGKDLVVKVQQNLPLTIAMTVVMSVLVAFWKKLLDFARRKLGFDKPKTEVLKPSVPEGDFVHQYPLDKFRPGFRVEIGWRGALVDAGVVQREFGPGRYGRRAVAKMIDSFRLGENARVVVWREHEFPMVLYLKDLFAADHQPMQLEIRATVRVRPGRLMHSSGEEFTQVPAHSAEDISAAIALPARQWVASHPADEPYRNADKLAEQCALAEGWIRAAIEGTAFELIRVADFRLFSPALDKVFAEYGDTALESEAARREVERNKVRGALRQAVLAGKLEEIHDQDEHERAVRAIEQEKSLRDKTLNQELAQGELSELEVKLKLWKRKQELLLQMLDPAGGEAAHALETADSPFSAHEREQIRAIVKGQVNHGTDIAWAAFDPLGGIRGAHTLRVGEGWRFFDGSSLWQVRLTRIETRRHGFLWHSESPAQLQFEVKGTPGGGRFEQAIALNGGFRLTAGPHELNVKYLGGSASRVSLQVGE